MKTVIVPLNRVSTQGSNRAGQKAILLGELLTAGFPVPDGFVLLPGPNGPGSDAETADAIAAGWAALGGGPVAVRSSASEEDLADASYAGQYETFLDVDTLDGLLEAVADCRMSRSAERVAAYEAGRGLAPARDLAVLVQRLVAADAAGIAFTANPVTGNRSETVINAVRGLGDRAASGEATPEQWLVTADGAVQGVSNGDGSITSVQARAVAELARRVADHSGIPQDIEWAIAENELFLLQARPITALPELVTPIPVSVEVPEGFWQRDASHAPKPNTPMFSSLTFPFLNIAGKAWFAEYGFLSDGMEWREIAGWQYISLRPLGGKQRKPPPAWLMPLLIRLVPPLRSRVKSCVDAVRSDRANLNLKRWYEEWKPDLRSRAEALQDVTLAELDDSQLDRRLVAISTLISDATTVHFTLHGAVFLNLGELVFTCRELLGWDDPQTLDLLSGLSGTSTEPAAKLTELAQLAAANQRLLDLFSQSGPVDPERLAEIDPAFGAAFDLYCRTYGYRALRYELVDPTLTETPDLLIQLIRDQIVSGFDLDETTRAVREATAEKLEKARSLLADKPSRRERFERALDGARAAYPVREDNEFFTISLPLGLARLTALELGQRLAERGQIMVRDDVFFLEFAEARRALSSGDSWDTVVDRRKGVRAWVEAHPGPGSYGKDPGPPPSFAALPPEARFAMEALLWGVDRSFETHRSVRRQKAGPTPINGVAASGGSYTGPVRVVMDETQFAKIQPGDVLVCPVTSPVWSVLFPSIGALVADTGGILSHPAIIAREYRIPAVVATGNATQLLNDGQLVTVNGTSGAVELDGTNS